ncbi:MAG TPA: allantoinase AllB [Pyrinomonadaceae bacterium]|nr:allantoinase AllB [Pyrinomonadaceae bacterium]
MPDPAATNLIIRGRQVVLPDGIAAAAVHIGGHTITAITDYDTAPSGCELIQGDDEAIVMPGMVDTHVHVNEPGRTEWEGFATATRAAAAGGTTTIIDMPLNSIPPTTTLAGFEAKLDSAKEQCYVDVGFWGGVIPGNTHELEPLFDAGVVGFKCFLVHSGVDEFPNVSEIDLRAAMPVLTKLGAVLIVHAEVPGPIEEHGTAVAARDYETFLRTRPRSAENQAIEMMIRLSREYRTRVHIVHHSSADALPALRAAKAANVKITAETCPHYLAIVAEEVADGATEFKCCPPIRELENREQLWKALEDKTIDMIVSDHSPCPPDMKLRNSGDFIGAWGGISSLQLRLPIVWTEARRRGLSTWDLSRWLCSAPAALVGLGNRKGALATGYDADVIIWNPAKSFRVEGEKLHHRHKLTPYEGRELTGVVERTFLRGEQIYIADHINDRPIGELIRMRTALSQKN